MPRIHESQAAEETPCPQEPLRPLRGTWMPAQMEKLVQTPRALLAGSLNAHIGARLSGSRDHHLTPIP